MKHKKYESTAKELAFKAFCDAKFNRDTRYDEFEYAEIEPTVAEFENWWKEHFHNRFEGGTTVFVNLKQYILAE